MPLIKPVSELRNNFAEISKTIHETSEPIFFTKNGYGDMVVMRIDAYEKLKVENEIFLKLKEAELQAKNNHSRLTHDEVFHDLRKIIQNKAIADEL